MSVWLSLLRGMLLWTAHFFAVYGIASLFPGTRLGAWLVIVATLLALAVTTYLLVATLRRRGAQEDSLTRWSSEGGALLYALAWVAILYQGMPALLE